MDEEDWDEFDDRDDIDLSEEICEDCWGESDPIDDCFYCPTCSGVGWVYGEMLRAPHLSHYDCEQLAKAEKEAARAGQERKEQGQ